MLSPFPSSIQGVLSSPVKTVRDTPYHSVCPDLGLLQKELCQPLLRGQVGKLVGGEGIGIHLCIGRDFS